MSHHPPTTRPTPIARFRHGALECTVVSDGILEMGPAHVNFPTARPEDVAELLTRHHLAPERTRLNENVLVVDTGDALVQFDAGVGTDPALGRGFFGPGTGHVVPTLAAAGIAAADIDVVAITHTHPDHVWGLIDPDGAPVYPNARIAVSREDVEHWTDLGRVATSPNQHMADHYIGAHKALTPYLEAGRVDLVADGDEVAPGIEAIATPGHSPGHLIYRITSEGEAMVVWGDLCHHQVLLLQHPEWSFQFDFDQPAATAQRWRVYDMVNSARDAVLAYHFPFPGLGHLRRDGEGYAWLPVEVERMTIDGVASTAPGVGAASPAPTGDRSPALHAGAGAR